MTADLDRDQLARRATAAVRAHRPGGVIADLQPLPGGISSLTFAAMLSDAARRSGRVVVKVAPPGLPPVRNRDVLRQARVLRALHDLPGVRVPRVLGEQDGSPPLFVMEFIEGRAYEPRWEPPPSPTSPTAAELRSRVQAAATMLAHMHAPSPQSIGLVDEPPLSPQDELGRWARLFETAGDDLRGDERALYEALAARTPAALPPRVAHGDYRLGNLQFAGERLEAILDWELWSIGDPRADLGWLVMFCAPAIERAPPDAPPPVAMPDPSIVVGAYEQVRPGASERLSWFVAAAHYKLAAAMSVLAKRNRRADNPDATVERAAQTLPQAIARGLELLQTADS
jgi:aminoglycoside phosphotransferase (APT) family kinase protein